MTKHTHLFEPVVEQLSNKKIGIFGPESFTSYLNKHHFPKVGPARYISIDSLEELSATLKRDNCMVLRLGRGTFVVIKIENRLNDFFLIDDKIFSDAAEKFIPNVEPDQLLAFKILPTLTEKSLVNLGFTSGLISYSLELDTIRPIFPPATCHSTFSFKFYPHSKVKKVLKHHNGQVEIDAMFIEKRKGKKNLFVIETKTKEFNKSLAKHKLIYPILGIAHRVPTSIEIVPVYLKVKSKEDGVHFHIVECYFPDPRQRLVAIDELTVKRYKHVVLPQEVL